jgi:hypothetical protein
VSVCIGAVLAIATAPASAATPQQVLWYPFDDGAGSTVVTDASGNGRDGTVFGGVTLDGDAAHLDGAGGYIGMPDDLLSGLDAISVVAKIFIEESQAAPYFIYGMGNTDGDVGNGYLFTSGDSYRTSISDCHWSCEQTTSAQGARLPRGTWLTIAYTLEDGVGILYLNGRELGRNESVTLTPGDIGSGTTVANFLGRSLYAGDHYFHGRFGDFQIWDGALSAEELATNEPSQLLWYPFDDDPTSTYVTDASGNSNTGTLFGGVTLDGGVATLNGTDGYVQLPNNIMAGLDAISITTLVYIERAQRAPYFIYGLGNTSGDWGWGYLFATGNHHRTTISSCHWSCEENTGTPGIHLGRSGWHHLAYALADGIGILYLDGQEVARNSNITTTPGEIGDGATTANYLGRSLYSGDHLLHGRFGDFQIWDGALNPEAIAEAAAQALAVPELSDRESVAVDQAALEITNIDDVRGHLFLPTSGDHGTTIQWYSTDPDVIATDGIVHRAPACTGLNDLECRNGYRRRHHHRARGNKHRHPSKHEMWLACGTTRHVTLFARISKGRQYAHKRFRATVPPLPALGDFEGYMFTYFTGEGHADGEQVYFALSHGNDPLHWQALNNEQPVLTSTLGDRGARDPFILRSPEGDKFYMIATDLKIHGNWDWGRVQTWGSLSLLVWESTDLVNWSDARLVQVSPNVAGNTWAPEAFWDAELQHYVVFWASKIYDDEGHSHGTYNRMMYSLTRDFVNFSEARVWVDAGYSTIDSTLIEQDGVYYRFTKDERSPWQSSCGKFILSETSTSLTDPAWDLQTECIGKGDMSQGEGPLVFKSNTEERWYLFIDEFGGRGYVPFESTDLASGVWTAVSDYDLPARPRHGTVLPITAEEHAAVLEKWGHE